MIPKKKFNKFFGISLVFLFLAFIITSIPMLAQAQENPICRIPINFNNWNPWADFNPSSSNFNPTVLDQLKCSFWNVIPEGHYQFYIEHPSTWFLDSRNIDVYIHPDDGTGAPSEIIFAHENPIIAGRETIDAATSRTYFRIAPTHVDGLIDPWSFAEAFVKIYLSYNEEAQDLDPNTTDTFRLFEINVRDVNPFVGIFIPNTILPANNTTIYNFFNAYIEAQGDNRTGNGGDGLYCFMDANDLNDDPDAGWDLAVTESGDFQDLSNLMITVNENPGTEELGEGTYGLRFRAATTGARHENPVLRNNISTQQFLDQTNERNATTDYGATTGCPNRSFDIRLPVDPANPPPFTTVAGDYVVRYGTTRITVQSVWIDTNGDYVLRLLPGSVAAAGITDAMWNDLPIPLMVRLNAGIFPVLYAGVDDGVGPMLLRVNIFTAAEDPADPRTEFVFSSELDPTVTVTADDFRIWSGGGSGSNLDQTTFDIDGNKIIAHEPLEDGDRVNVAADNGIMDLNGNQAIVLCAQVEAHTVRMVSAVAATAYWIPGVMNPPNPQGVWEITIEYSGEMLAMADGGRADDPALYEVTFPDDPGVVHTPFDASFDPFGILGAPFGFGQRVVKILVQHTSTDTSPNNMPTVTILTTTDPATGETQPLGDTGGDFVGPTVFDAQDLVGPFINQIWYMIDGECGKTSATLLSEGKHYLMLEWSEPIRQSDVDIMEAEGRDWLVFGNILGQNWTNVDVPFGLDWDLLNGVDTDHTPDPNIVSRVLSIKLGTSDNGASEIIFWDLAALDPVVTIRPQNLDDISDVLGNPVITAQSAIVGVNNLPITIQNMTTPWIETAATGDADADGKIDELLLTWNRKVVQLYHVPPPPAPANLHFSDTVDNSTVTSPVYGPREITDIIVPPKPDNGLILPGDYIIDRTLTLTETPEPFVFDTDYTGTLSLYLDANSYFRDRYGNVRDQVHAGGCPVVDGAPPVPIRACIWIGAIAGTYEVEIHFSEPVVDLDPNVSPEAYFTVQGIVPGNYSWLNWAGSDSILNFMVRGNIPAPPPSPTISIVGTINDYAGNAAPLGDIEANTPITVQGPAVKPDYFAYPSELPPFAVGPIITDASMDLEGYISWGGVPLDQKLYQECSPCCNAILMAFRHKDLFDPDPLSADYGKLILDPARCVGATRLRRHDGYYAIHIYGEDCAGNDVSCQSGEAIILVVVIYNECPGGGSNVTAASWPLDVTDPLYINDVFIMTGKVPADTGYYLKWVNSAVEQQPNFNMELDDCEKIYLRAGWNHVSTTIDKVYYDEDGTQFAPWVINPAQLNYVSLRNNAGAMTAVPVAMDDVEKVFATISPPLPTFPEGNPLGWRVCCTFDPNIYASVGGAVFDYPETDPRNGQNAIAYFGAGSGYLLNMANDGVLVVLGTSVLDRDPNTQPYSKSINNGWNMVGYWSDMLNMTSTAPSLTNFAPGDFSTVWSQGPFVFPGPGVNLGPADNSHFAPNTIFMGAGATHLRTNVNIRNAAFTDVGVRVWDINYQAFDFKYIGPGMGAWMYATANTLQFDP
jgi:hypothetical protein